MQVIFQLYFKVIDTLILLLLSNIVSLPGDAKKSVNKNKN